MTLRDKITSDMKDAMRAHEAAKLSTIRMLLAAIKQKEVDERKTLDDSEIEQVVGKLIKQRKDSVEQYLAGGRKDLADKEANEIKVLETYLPKQLDEKEIEALVDKVLKESGLTGMASMGKAMALLKPQVAGKADMGKVSAILKAKLSK